MSSCRDRISEAEKYYRAALELRQRTLGATHQNVANTEAALGSLLTGRGDYGEAERLLRDAVEIRRKGLPPTHWQIGYTQALLGRCLAVQHRFTDAEPLILKGYEILREKRGDGREETRQAVATLVALYQAW